MTILKTQSLPADVLNIVQDKHTEQPFTGEYEHWDKPGTFLCRQCGQALFRSYDKFSSGCGWPSFDEEIAQTVVRQPDIDARRTEIVCSQCGSHLGHVFKGEKFTSKDTRHCVNSLSLDFVSDLHIKTTEEALFAAGCFWGVEYYFKKLSGVLKAECGYAGGPICNPSYEEVCKGNTGHFETVRVIYDPEVLSYQKLAQYFFEIHDPAQINRQGPDHGEHYSSVIFYYTEAQKNTAKTLIVELEKKHHKTATKILPVSPFFRAADYHQNYYEKTQGQPYCHRLIKKF